MRAIAYVPDDAAGWLPALLSYCDRHGYRLVEVTGDWVTAVRELGAGAAEVLVVGTRAHLAAHRVPRIEVVDEQQPSPGGEVRPRRLW